MAEHKGLEVMLFPTQAAFRKWLRREGRRSQGIWIKFAKKGSGHASVTYEEAREEALANGWIDGLLNSLDDAWFLRRFTPRRPRSKWSRINREIAEGLIAD
ncbi:MAG: bacteriocin-protection protein, partial [Myxococcales bacterium]|nr:bacteriocin-protection protein [Myxococcales bacterium]